MRQMLQMQQKRATPYGLILPNTTVLGMGEPWNYSTWNSFVHTKESIANKGMFLMCFFLDDSIIYSFSPPTRYSTKWLKILVQLIRYWWNLQTELKMSGLNFTIYLLRSFVLRAQETLNNHPHPSLYGSVEPGQVLCCVAGSRCETVLLLYSLQPA